MVVKHICMSKKLKVDLFTTPDKSFFGSYYYLLARDKLLIPHNYGGGLRKPISKCIA